ncbi:caspase family protein [Candidatus Uabimicrobium amorphum]|uniref:Peptidase C14 caspase domain-containing protein n=1 Tax=Uabimicrobium amorphum TaxID=2596890 RepID=A0A5S9IT19_UABAM|nr:caspase family protein [Candidatus Uabimicrobium amorphum]BBM86610.1 hypothetical protein UABAM_04996 [Candidatus Uabimicrobium amorphum]
MKNLLVTLFFLLVSSLAAENRYLYITNLEVAEKKGNGHSWDSFGGKPDLVIKVFIVRDAKQKKVYTSAVYKNAYNVAHKIFVNCNLVVGDKLRIEVEDSDLANNDKVGSFEIDVPSQECEKTAVFTAVKRMVYVFSQYNTWEKRQQAVQEAKKQQIKKDLQNKRLRAEAKLREKIARQEQELRTKMLRQRSHSEDDHKISEVRVSKKQLRQLVQQLQSKEENQRYMALEKLEGWGKQGEAIRTDLQRLLPVVNEPIKFTLLAALEIIDQHSFQTFVPQKTNKSLYGRKSWRTNIAKRSLGGLNILGPSEDFPAELKYSKCCALIVGINRYDHFTPLKGLQLDAARIAAVLDSRYNFTNVVLLTDRKPQIPQGNVEWRIVDRVTKSVINSCLWELGSKINPQDALFFYYTGHGAPGHIVCADSYSQASGKTVTQSMIPLKKMAEILESFTARHTLMVLDSCYSQTLLEEQYRPDFSHFANEDSVLRGGDNLNRVFHRRAFQVITGGFRGEAKQWEKTSTTYAYKFRNREGHSLLTANLLQALHGLVGRADGTILASQLGYYITNVFANNNRIEVAYKPRYDGLGGDGDFMFFPTTKVLNPKLLSPLYLTHEDYANLRSSACISLRKYIFNDTTTHLQLPLAQNVIPHLVHLLNQDEPQICLNAAVQLLLQIAKKYGESADNLSQVVTPLTKLLKAKKNLSNKKLFYDIALILSHTSPYATADAIKQVRNYVNILEVQWQQNKKKLLRRKGLVHPSVQMLEAQIAQKMIAKPVEQDNKMQMQYWGSLYRDFHWLSINGLRLLREYEKKINKYETMMALAEKSYDQYADLGEEETGYYMKQEKAFRECGAYAGEALHHIRDLKGVEDLRKKAQGFARLAYIKRKEMWRSSRYSHTKSVTSISFSPDGKILASASKDQTIGLWDVAIGKRMAKISVNKPALFAKFSPDGESFAYSLSNRTIRLRDVKTGKKQVKITGHTDDINAMDFHPGGKMIVSASSDQTIRLWNIQTGKEVMKIEGHSAAVNSVCFNFNGKTIASGSSDGTIKIWDTQTGKEKKTITTRLGDVKTVRFSPDGNTVVSISNNRIQLWRLTTGKEITKGFARYRDISCVCFAPNGKQITFGSNNGILYLFDLATRKEVTQITTQANAIHAVAFSPDGQTLACGVENGTLILWDVENDHEISNLNGHTNTINALCFSPDKNTIASSSVDTTIRLWDTITGKQMITFTGHTNTVQSICFNPNGTILASGSKDFTVRLWDVVTGREIHKIKAHDNTTLSVRFSPSGKVLATGSADATIGLWDVTTGTKILTMRGHTREVSSVCFSPDGKILASASEDKTIRLWDIKTGKELKKLVDHTGMVSSACFSPNGKILASGSSDHTVKLWDVATGEVIDTLIGHTYWVLSVCFSADGKKLVSGGTDGTMRLWEMDTRKLYKTIQHSRWVSAVCFSPNDEILASASIDGVIRLWDSGTVKEIRKIGGHVDTVNSVCFHPKEKVLASGSSDKTVKLWDISKNKQVENFTNHAQAVNTVHFSHDGTFLASGSSNGYIKLWNIKNGWQINEFEACDKSVNSVCFSPDGKTIVSAADDAELKLWDIVTRQQIRKFTGHKAAVNSVCFSSDGEAIVSASNDATLRLWNVATGRQIRKFTGHTAAVNSVRFSPDGKSIVSASNDTTLRFWNVATEQQVRIFTGHVGAVNSVRFSPDGKSIVSVSNDATLRLWDIATGKEMAKISKFATKVNTLDFTTDGKSFFTGADDGAIRLWRFFVNKKLNNNEEIPLSWAKKSAKISRPNVVSEILLLNALRKNPRRFAQRLFGLRIDKNMDPVVYKQRK